MKIIKKILIGSIAGPVAIGAGLALWFSRGPTTQLVDASGKALTAGTAPQEDGASLGGSLFDEARALIQRKEFAAAQERLLRVMEESDRDGEACILLCDVSRELKDVAAAADYGLKAVELLPGSAEENGFHVALADIYAEQKRFDAADAEYEAARRSVKDKPYYRSLYGQARMRIQNQFEPARAVELLDEFIADEPESDTMQTVAHACWRKGNALQQLGRKEDARQAYEESLRRDPTLELARKALQELGN